MRILQILAVLLAAGPGLLRAWRGWVKPRRKSEPADVLTFARLLALAVAGGLPLSTALPLAAQELAMAAPIEDLLRRSRALGLSRALLETKGPLAPLAARLARAQVSGAPVAAALEAFVEETMARERQRRLERVRTLPVRLIVPVSLLLLPGFVALVVGPTIAEQISAFLRTVTGP